MTARFFPLGVESESFCELTLVAPCWPPYNWQLEVRAEMGESESSTSNFQFLLLDTHVWDPNFDIDFVLLQFFILVLKLYDSTLLSSIP